MVPADSDRVSLAPPYSGYWIGTISYKYGTITLYGPTFQLCSPYNRTRQSVLQPQYVNILVWACPRSLATTYGITFVFSSSPYLDVSVQEVWRSDMSSTYRVSPFGHLRIKGLLHLPAAFRSLTRPSSPSRAKASPVRPCKLPNLYPYNLKSFI